MPASSLPPEIIARLEEYLQPSHIVLVATIGRTGIPQLTPNWYVYEDGKIAISTTKERAKYRNLARDSRMSVCIYSGPMAENYLSITGSVEILDGDEIWPVTRRIVERYVPLENAQARMDMLMSENRVILSLSPETAVFRG